ncbi:hypothetical protein AS149_33505 [Burkholderia cenocepacia]|nr:hypothetical protein AS149_33505 [Burkholderia cenocepacia]
MNARPRCRLPGGPRRQASPLRQHAAHRPAAPRPIAPQIVLHVPGNTRRFCVLSDAERCANDFLP